MADETTPNTPEDPEYRHVATFNGFVTGTKTDGKGDFVITIGIPRSAKWDAMPITDEGVLQLRFTVEALHGLNRAVDPEQRRVVLERMRQGLEGLPWAGQMGDGTGNTGRGADNKYGHGYKESDRIDSGLVAQADVKATERRTR